MSATVNGGLLLVEGSSLSDLISIRIEPGPTDAPGYTVEIGPADGSDRPVRYWHFDLDSVRSVSVRAGIGDDVVDLALATYPTPTNRFWFVEPVPVPSRIDGGFGGDMIHGGSGRDFITDPWGNDRIDGHGGDDWISGGRGSDIIRGGEGNDYLSGGPRADYMHGGGGDDVLSGGEGNDGLGGDAGNDRLYGGPGNDSLGSQTITRTMGEPGDDFLDGGDGNDFLFGGVGTDRVYGGPGRDTWLQSRYPGELDLPSEWLDRTPEEPVEVIQPPA